MSLPIASVAIPTLAIPLIWSQCHTSVPSTESAGLHTYTRRCVFKAEAAGMAHRPASRALLACLIFLAIGCASADLPHSDGTKAERALACAKYAPLYTNIDLDLAPWAEAGISSDLINQSMHAYDHTPRQKVKAFLIGMP